MKGFIHVGLSLNAQEAREARKEIGKGEEDITSAQAYVKRAREAACIQ
jgi:hypothetical protein